MHKTQIIENIIAETTPLTQEYFTKVFELMLSGELNSSQIAGILSVLRTKKLTGELLAGAAKAMRKASIGTLLSKSSAKPRVDNCGTGGDGSNSFNISTTSALLAACAGLGVIKHGNRSISSKCGSADLLAEIGYPLQDLSIEAASELFEQFGFSFLYAPAFHPGMKFVMPVRKELAIPTIFNLLGPLANPLSPDFQLIGVGSQEFTQPVAEALRLLGINKGLVVHSEDGMDEISPFAPTHGYLVENGKTSPWSFIPSTLIPEPKGTLKGGLPTYNAEILEKMLNGEHSSYSETVCLNCGALLWIAGKDIDIQAGYLRSKELLTSGKARSFVDTLIKEARSRLE